MPIEAPFYPIVYIRGYAMSMSEIEDTVADPYMGFNLGSTKIRQRWDKKIVKYFFESPLIRLMKEHGYVDIYDDGDERSAVGAKDGKSIWIFRYYEESSGDLGTGKVQDIEFFARRLGELVERMRDELCGPALGATDEIRKARKAFKIHLVAHSMGGLIARCYLQNIAAGKETPVDRVFTYGTPHGGIDLRGLGNIPSFVKFNEIDTFSEKRMRDYLKIPKAKPVTSLNGAFDESRFFCLVGTDYKDYDAAKGLAQRAVGPMSDGLVMIRNAAVDGAPRAFVHRAHSGHYGIVNSEEGYQNLKRFLFGNVRVEALLEIEELSLPPNVQKEVDAGKKVKASYHAEVVARVRGKRWALHRRTVDEESAIFIPFEKVKAQDPVHLASAFLMRSERVDKSAAGLGFSLDLGVVVPEYEIDGALFLKQHFEGGYLYREKINLEIFWENGEPRLRYGFDSKQPNQTSRSAEVAKIEENGGFVGYEFRIPVAQNTRPGMKGTLILRSFGWG